MTSLPNDSAISVAASADTAEPSKKRPRVPPKPAWLSQSSNQPTPSSSTSTNPDNTSKEPPSNDASKISSTSAPPRAVSPPIQPPVQVREEPPVEAREATTQRQEGEAAALQAQEHIEIDFESDALSVSDGGESGYESDANQSASTSISSSVRDFAFENGRRYHKFREGSYNFPNDDSEQEREDMKHAMMVNLCQRLHFAPIEDGPQNILDLGTGTGIWAIEMGDLYPSAKVLGVDLSPIQPEWVPPNVQFMVDDVESPWLRPLNHFDYIHARHTVMAIRDWPKLMGQVLDHLKPGGWFELQEIHHYPQCHDGSMPENHPVTEYWGLIIEALAALGVNFNATLLLADMMRDAGFVNVTTRVFHVPIGTWPANKILKMVGLYWRTILEIGLQPIALGPLTRGLGWSVEQVEVWLIEVRKAYKHTWVHSHMPLHIICGQKPGPGVVVQ